MPLSETTAVQRAAYPWLVRQHTRRRRRRRRYHGVVDALAPGMVIETLSGPRTVLAVSVDNHGRVETARFPKLVHSWTPCPDTILVRSQLYGYVRGIVGVVDLNTTPVLCDIAARLRAQAIARSKGQMHFPATTFPTQDATVGLVT